MSEKIPLNQFIKEVVTWKWMTEVIIKRLDINCLNLSVPHSDPILVSYPPKSPDFPIEMLEIVSPRLQEDSEGELTNADIQSWD